MFRRPVTILHGVEGAEHCAEVPVAYAFRVTQRILVVAAFPKPLTMMVARVGEILHVEIEGPWSLGETPRFAFLAPSPHVAHSHAAFRRHGEIGSGEVANCAMSSAVREQGAAESRAFTGANVEGMDGQNAFVGRFHLVGVMVEIKIDIVFRPYDGFLLGVAEFLVGAGRLLCFVGEFLDDFSDARILASPNISLCPDANLAGSVAPEYRPVLNEGYLASHAGCREGGPHAGVTAANDHQVIVLLDRVFRKIQQLLPPDRQDGRFVGRGEFVVRGEVERVAASIETGQVLEGQFHLSRIDFHHTSVMPMPLGSLGPEGFAQRLAID